MPSTTPAISNTPANEERAEAQRRRILDAAQRCFIAHGFHAASISDIAGEAGISQGLMYRYFDNKRAMILALIDRQLGEDKRSIEQMPASTDMADGLLVCYRQWARGISIDFSGTAIANTALYAEITAEAQRDPLVAEVLHRYDQQINRLLVDWLRGYDAQRGRKTETKQLQQRTLLLRVLVEGLAMRATRQPKLSTPVLRGMLEQCLRQVLAE